MVEAHASARGDPRAGGVPAGVSELAVLSLASRQAAAGAGVSDSCRHGRVVRDVAGGAPLQGVSRAALFLVADERRYSGTDDRRQLPVEIQHRIQRTAVPDGRGRVLPVVLRAAPRRVAARPRCPGDAGQACADPARRGDHRARRGRRRVVLRARPDRAGGRAEHAGDGGFAGLSSVRSDPACRPRGCAVASQSAGPQGAAVARRRGDARVDRRRRRLRVWGAARHLQKRRSDRHALCPGVPAVRARRHLTTTTRRTERRSGGGGLERAGAARELAAVS